MSKIEVDAIDKQSGSTLTLGGSGTAVTLASGATQSGFGRTGTVDWNTTKKTADFTATNGDGFFVDTSSGAVTVTLPASPSAGDIVAVSDYASTSNTNNITIGRNSSNIEGSASNIVIANNGVALTFVYVDATRGWKVVDAGQLTDKDPAPEFVAATGGNTVATCGDFKIHTFTGPGTFTVSSAGNTAGSNTIDYLVVAGGAGGGSSRGGGGGAGGYRESSGAASGCYSRSPLGACVSALPVTATGYPVAVGAGGAGGSSCSTGTSGSNSVFTGSSTITSAGGGGGGSIPKCTGVALAGGSGGGQTSQYSPGLGPVGGAGNTPPVSPPQGNTGGKGFDGLAVSTNGGGGGAATAVGGDAACRTGGAGGAGATSSITSSPVTRSGGGGGGTDGGTSSFQAAPSPSSGGAGGSGGGGAGNPNNPSATPSGTAGTANTGGGGGGGGSSTGANGGAGGSGIVIIRYKFQ